MFEAIKVPKNFAEEVRSIAEKYEFKDKSRRIKCSGNFVEIPIVSSDVWNYLTPKLRELCEIIEQKNPEFSNKRELLEVLKGKIPDKLLSYVPKSYKIIGDVILVKIHKKLENYAELIGESLLEVHPHCKSVWWDKGKWGMLRKPEVVLIAGKGSVTIHRENGCLFKLDIREVMFSPGNQAERIRMGKITGREVVVDMFAGIGYFTIPICVHSNSKVYSIEINPKSYRFLIENLKLNKLKGNCIPILGDSMYVTPENIADRVIMGHINCQEFLPVAFKALRGKGYVHYHESVPEVVVERPIRRLVSAAKKYGKNVKIVNVRKIKNYSPGVVHIVVDAYLS